MGNAKEKAAFDGGEGIILRLTEKFGVVREGEMTRRESEPTQLDERSERHLLAVAAYE